MKNKPCPYCANDKDCWKERDKFKVLAKELLQEISEYHLHTPGERTAICQTCLLEDRAIKMLQP